METFKLDTMHPLVAQGGMKKQLKTWLSTRYRNMDPHQFFRTSKLTYDSFSAMLAQRTPISLHTMESAIKHSSVAVQSYQLRAVL